MTKVQREHFALITKYLGISFITGGLSHWFFSWERQIITAIVGVSLFVLGTMMMRKEEKDFWRTVLYSSLFAIALWAFTGGMQHFPDSPERSLFIVPLGFVFSVYFYFLVENHHFWKRENIYYILISWIISVVVSLGIYELIQFGYAWGDDHHGISSEQSSTNTQISETSSLVNADLHVEGDEHDH